MHPIIDITALIIFFRQKFQGHTIISLIIPWSSALSSTLHSNGDSI
jgi:hypothetical protein